MTETAPPGLIRRFFTTWRQLTALAAGGVVVSARLGQKPYPKGLRHRFHRTTAVDDTQPLRISRLRVSDTTAIDRLDTITSGLHPTLHGLRSRVPTRA